MGLDRDEFKGVHEAIVEIPAAFESDAHHSTECRHVFLRQLMVRIILQARIFYPSHIRMILKIFRYLHGALAVPGYADVQALETQVKIECVLRALDGAKVPHQLARGLGDESQFPKGFGIYQTVV